MTTNPASKFAIPSYLDFIDGPEVFQELADSINGPGPLRFKKVLPGYVIQPSDVNQVLRLDDEGEVVIPQDDQSDIVMEIGSQIGILNYSDQRVVVNGQGGVVVVSGGTRNVVDKWKMGVLMKYNANFWLLSLGSGASGGNATPTEPKLLSAVGSIKKATLTWSKPLDDGGFPIKGYRVEQSKDNKTFTEVARLDVVLTATVTVSTPGTYYYRVKAFNEVGESNPSNVLAAQVTFEAPTLAHGPSQGTIKITNYDPTNTYKITSTSGTGKQTGDTISHTPTKVKDFITVTAVAGGVESAPKFVGIVNVTQHNEYVPYQVCVNPCGNCRTDVDPHTWGCGCGSPCGDSGGGQWGDCVCHGPGYNHTVDDAPPSGWSKWGSGPGGDFFILSDKPLQSMKQQVLGTEVRLDDAGVSGQIRAPWAVYANDEWSVAVDSMLLRVRDDSGRTVLVLTPEWDTGCIGYVWEGDAAWLSVRWPLTLWADGVDGSLRWELMAQTANANQDTWPELVVHVDGEVRR